MGILTGLFRSRDKPQNRTAGSGYSFYMGGSAAGKSVTERSAIGVMAPWLMPGDLGLPLGHGGLHESDESLNLDGFIEATKIMISMIVAADEALHAN